MKKCVLFPIILLHLFNLDIGKAEENTKKLDIPYLEKVGEIKDGFSEGEVSYFWHIDDLACDENGYLYVADAGWNKILKFDPEGKYMGSFGRSGQGPGEFMAEPSHNRLKISIGWDKYIYINDTGNMRLSLFSYEGKFIKQFKLPRFYRDSAKINSKGDIYLISKDGVHAIDCYDRDFKLKDSFLELKLHNRAPFFKEPEESARHLDDWKIKKVITKQDHIIVLSNIAVTVFHYDENHNLINKFPIKHTRFEKDFEECLGQVVSKGGFMIPFPGFLLDKEENLILFHYNCGVKRIEIYRYKVDGTFIDIYKFPDETMGLFSIDQRGRIYSDLDVNKIGIYKIKNP